MHTIDGIANIYSREIERRRERVRRAWAYQRVDHLPIAIVLEDLGGHTLREVCEDGLLQYELNRRAIDRLLRLFPDDYLPAARVWPGYMTIATMFGLPVHWSDDPNQAPGVREHPITDMAQVYALPHPDPAMDGLMPFNLRWLRYFAEQFPPEVSLAGIDLGGPMNTAKDLLDTDLLYLAFYDEPEAFRHLLSLAADVQVECYREIVKAAGGVERMTCIDFDPAWAPEGRKGFISDDVCASFSPEIFREFSTPYNNRIFREWPGGRIHNCGPHPAIDLYLDHMPPINGLNCSFRHTRADLPRIREAFKGRGIVEFMFDCGESVEEIIAGYEEIADTLAPDVVGIPILWFTEEWSDGAMVEVYNGLVRVGERYAREMQWSEP
jgi:uroporphyrinogen-III decarboxylase